jgi:hypothetical protein
LPRTHCARSRDQYPGFDELIVKKIDSGEIKRAVDIRDELPVICTGPVKALKKFVEGKIDFDEAHTVAFESGGENPGYKKLNRFGAWLGDPDTENELAQAAPHVLDKIQYELAQIERIARKLKKSTEE